MALSLTAASVAWSIHYHSDSVPCAEVTVSATILNSANGNTVQRSTSHSIRCANMAALVSDKTLEQNIVTAMKTALTNAGVDISNWASVFTRTVDGNYPSNS